MARYSSNNDLGGVQQAISGTFKTLLSLTAETATLTNAKVYDVLFGTNGTPADNFLEYDISRQTAAGTATAVLPVLIDPGNRAAGSIAEANYTAEGTITAASSLFFIGVNQRASYRWVANPGSELIIPAVDENGVAFRALSAGYTGTATCTMMHEE